MASNSQRMTSQQHKKHHISNGSNGTSSSTTSTSSNHLPRPPLLQDHHLDREELRAQALTESILYRFIPSAIYAITSSASGVVKENKDQDDGEEEQRRTSIATKTKDPLTDITPQEASSVACASLIVATLLNAPRSVLEFLLCVPWHELSQIYTRICGGDIISTHPSTDSVDGGATAAAETPQVLLHPMNDDNRPWILQWVNAKLENEDLIDCVMNFIYKPEHIDSLPLLLRSPPPPSSTTHAQDSSVHHQQCVFAQLQGCTPLHCAAIRGSPWGVEVLVGAGADALARNSLGELPLELVPQCNGTDSTIFSTMSRTNSMIPIDTTRTAVKTCRCTGAGVGAEMSDHPHSHPQQGPWECRSRLARLLLIRRTMGTLPSAINSSSTSIVQAGAAWWAWIQVVALCIVCMFGLRRSPTTVAREGVVRQGAAVWEERTKREGERIKARVRRFQEALRGEKGLGRLKE